MSTEVTRFASPLVSIVTPSFNQAHFLEKAILSVSQQDYPYIEHLVVDGGSTDGTLGLLERYSHRLRWISEPDNGQADAINKGFRMAKGAIFAWLNADDLYAPKAIRTVVEYFKTHPDAYFVYGDALAIDEYGRPYGLRMNVKPTQLRDLVQVGDAIVQPAAFWRAELWRTVGELDTTLHYNLDYEYWMRVAARYDLHYLPCCLAWERLYALAKTFTGNLERMEEMAQVAERHGGKGIPANFRPEAASYYWLRAWDHLLRRQWREAREDFRRAWQTNNSPSRLALYLGALLLFGDAGIPRLRLYSNYLRARLRRRAVCS